MFSLFTKIPTYLTKENPLNGRCFLKDVKLPVLCTKLI